MTAEQALRVSLPVRELVDERVNYVRRLAAGRFSNLTNEADLEAIYWFLLERSPLDAGQGGHVLKNAVLDSLTALDPLPPQLGDLLVQMYRDRNNHEVIRDYAVQHFADFYEQLDLSRGLDATGRQAGREQVQAALWEAVAETDSSIAGTALLGLSKLAANHREEFDRDRIGETALRLARQTDASALTRITALQVCANLGMREALPVALQTVRAGESIPERISAIGALGNIAAGNAEVKTFLEQIQNGGEPRLQLPAQLALKRIKQAEQWSAEVKRKS